MDASRIGVLIEPKIEADKKYFINQLLNLINYFHSIT